jgi:hypothetical protein
VPGPAARGRGVTARRRAVVVVVGGGAVVVVVGGAVVVVVVVVVVVGGGGGAVVVESGGAVVVVDVDEDVGAAIRAVEALEPLAMRIVTPPASEQKLTAATPWRMRRFRLTSEHSAPDL